MRDGRLTRVLRRASVFARHVRPLAADRLGTGRVTCLLYHRVAERSDRPYLEAGGVPVTPPAVFRKQLRRLRDDGLEFLAPGELLAGRLPAHPSVLLTFDDGFRDNFTTALSILREEGVKAFFFVVSSVPGSRGLLWEHALCRTLADGKARARLREAVSSTLGEAVSGDRLARAVRGRLPVATCDELLAECQPPGGAEEARALYPDWDEVRSAVQEGHVVGSHGRTHRMRHLLTAPQFREELIASKHEIGERLGEPVRSFSFPFNSYLFGDEEACCEAGYELVATVDPGRLDPSRGLLRVPRLTVHRLHDSVPELRRLVAEACD